MKSSEICPRKKLRILNIILWNRSTPVHGDCLQRKKTVLEQLENKLETGIDRSLSAIVGYIKVTLQTEQKKSDFKPETDDAIVNTGSPVNQLIYYVSQ